jgi:hypothetical protein
MKRTLLLVLVLLFAAGSVSAQEGYIGLFADDTHSSWCATGVGFWPVEVWVMCLPGALGQICAEFMVCNPANVITSTITWNTPLISVTLGDPDTGLSVCYVECQLNVWHWVYHRLYYVTDPTQTYIYICPHPDVGTIQFANCTPGYPTEPCIRYTNFYLNSAPPDDEECTVTATETASWGAIKSMYR